MGKNKKNKHRHQGLQPAPPPTPAPAVAPAPTPRSPEEAAVAIREATTTALELATDADLAAASSAAPPAPPQDLIAAAKEAQEALGLCAAMRARLMDAEAKASAREEGLTAREAAAAEREAVAAQREEALAASLRRQEEEARRLDGEAKALLQRQEVIIGRELDAEAGFAALRRASLAQLDAEAATLREALTQGRAAIAAERAAWEESRRAEEERLQRLRAEDAARGRAVEEEARAAAEAAAQAQRVALAEEREAVKRRAVTLEVEREVLEEDRAAFGLRVEQRAAASLEVLRGQLHAAEASLAAARAGRDELYARHQARDEAERALGNRPLEEVKRELDDLRREREALRAALAAKPGDGALARLQELERHREGWETERVRLIQGLAEARAAAARAAVAVTELEALKDQKAALETSRDLLQAALVELRKDVDERIRRADDKSPFPSCSAMDVAADLAAPPADLAEVPNLKAFCEDLRHRVAVDPSSERQLYYSARDVRAFVAGLAMSRLHLLHGISGTGKTSLPVAFARAVGAGLTVVEVQAGWRDRQDLIGHFNAFERRFYEAEFLQALYRAQTPSHAGRPYVIVLDEMNLSHPEQYFADLLSALEQPEGRRKIDLMTAPVAPAPNLLREGRTLPLPPNAWFVGTANHDETTKDFADKTYDRAHVMELPRHREAFSPTRHQPRAPVALDALLGAFARAQEEHAGAGRDSYAFIERTFADVLDRRFGIGWGNRLERQARDYVPVVVAAGGGVEEAVDHLLATKLLRKVRDRHDTRPEDLLALRAALVGGWEKQGWRGVADTRAHRIVSEELRRLGAEDEASP